VAFDIGDTDTQERCVSALEAQAEALGGDAERAVAASVRVSHAAAVEDLEQAGAAALKALALAQRTGHVPSAIRAHNQWGYALCAAGDLAQARHHAEEGLALARATANSRGQLNALGLLAQIAEAQGDYATARPYREQAISHFILEADQMWKHWAVCRAAAMGLRLGEYTTAEERLLGAYDAARSIGAHVHARDAAAQLAYAARLAERWSEVFEWTGNAGGLEGDQADTKLLPELLLHGGDAHAALGRLDEARDCYRRCVGLHLERNKPLQALDAHCGLARVCLATGDTVEALAHVADAVQRIVDDGWRGAGSVNPPEVVLTTYYVLKRVGDPRAPDVLAAGHSILMEQAAKLGPVASQTYLHTVKSNRRMCELWEARESSA
jgi:tetratricopeptide (TPR) repeat protein